MAAIDLTSVNFVQNINKEGLTLVDFWAEWCGPCQMQGPVIEELAQERSDITVCKVDVDKEGGLAAQYEIANIPALIIFKDGQMVKKLVGFHSREELDLEFEKL
ncbi:MAG: thioredoxin [Lachnospiraceae bacterium]|nr:thioredoxin [Lachnospiraceae bacterium]